MGEQTAANVERRQSDRRKRKGRFLRALRAVHGWIGVVVVPWVFIMGLTGFYLNHSKTIMSFVPQEKYDERQFNLLKPALPITEKSARILANSIWPELPVRKIWKKTYHGWPSYFVRKGNRRIILSIPTGHYYAKVRYSRQTFTPGGKLVHTKIYWWRILKDLHERGWIGGALGTWLTDIFSAALILFGLSGAIMWGTPRIRKLKRSSARP